MDSLYIQFKNQKKWDSAIYYVEKILQDTTKKNDSASLLLNYYRRGYCFHKSFDNLKALEDYNLALEISRKLKDEYHFVKISINQGNLLKSLGLYGEAQEIFASAIKYHKNRINTEHLFDLYNGLAIAASNNKEYEIANQAYQNAIQYSKSFADSIDTFNNQGVNLSRSGKPLEAISIYETLLNNNAIDSFKIKKYRIQSNLGHALCMISQKNALYYLKKALVGRKNINNPKELYGSYIHVTKYYIKNDIDSARKFADSALTIATNEIKNPSAELESLKLILEILPSNEKNVLRFLTLNDSIEESKKFYQNKYAAIKLFTQEREMENNKLLLENSLQSEEISKKQIQQMILFGIIFIVLILLFFSYSLHRQKQKNLHKQMIIEKLEAQEYERNRIAGNIHDDLAADLRTVMNLLDNLPKKNSHTYLTSINWQVEKIYEKTRLIAQDYQSPNFKRGFAKNFMSLITLKEKEYQVTIDTEGIDSIVWEKVEDILKTEIYRIVQESLLNIHKHAHATMVLISFYKRNNFLFLNVKDNGVGISKKEIIYNVGISNMEDRIKKLHGTLEIKTFNGEGFTISIGFPLKVL
ncbi:MAG: hypothetical protein R2776_07070 [Flavobacteriaceae bacterium]